METSELILSALFSKKNLTFQLCDWVSVLLKGRILYESSYCTKWYWIRQYLFYYFTTIDVWYTFSKKHKTHDKTLQRRNKKGIFIFSWVHLPCVFCFRFYLKLRLSRRSLGVSFTVYAKDIPDFLAKIRTEIL